MPSLNRPWFYLAVSRSGILDSDDMKMYLMRSIFLDKDDHMAKYALSDILKFAGLTEDAAVIYKQADFIYKRRVNRYDPFSGELDKNATDLLLPFQLMRDFIPNYQSLVYL
jgi:hypothetical protein